MKSDVILNIDQTCVYACISA